MKKIQFAVVIGFCYTTAILAQSYDSVRCAPVEAARREMCELAWHGSFDTLLFKQESFAYMYHDLTAMTAAERMLLDFWNERYDDIFATLEQHVVATPCIADESLLNVLSYQASVNSTELDSWIDATDYSLDHKRLLHDLLKDLTSANGDSSVAKIQEYKPRLDRISGKNKPNAQQLAPTKPKPKTIEPDGDFFFWGLQSGVTTLTGNVSRFIQPKQMYVLVAGASSDRIVGDIRLAAAFMPLRKDYPVDDDEEEWLAGDKSAMLNVGANVGVIMLDTDSWRIAPTLGLWYNTFAPARIHWESDEENPVNEAKRRTVSASVGGSVMFKFPPFYDGQIFISLNVHYQPHIYGMSNKTFTGDLMFYSLGLGFIWQD